MSWFNWLPLSDRKNISIPNVYIEEYSEQPYGGYYQGDSTHPYIVVVDGPDTRIESVLAHEFRHHIQAELNQCYSPHGSSFRTDLPYEDSIRLFFRTQQFEMDALLYEHRYAKTELNDWWLNHLVKPEKFAGVKL